MVDLLCFPRNEARCHQGTRSTHSACFFIRPIRLSLNSCWDEKQRKKEVSVHDRKQLGCEEQEGGHKESVWRIELRGAGNSGPKADFDQVNLRSRGTILWPTRTPHRRMYMGPGDGQNAGSISLEHSVRDRRSPLRNPAFNLRPTGVPQ